MSPPKRIGGDWVEHVDKTSGKKYYANLVTKATSWTFPEELNAAVEEAKNSAGPEDWVERADPASGRKYYYNKKSRETSWTKPPGFGAATSAASPAAAPTTESAASKWNTRTDPKTGRVYYYNKETRETSWVKPAELESSEVPNATAAATATAVDAAPTPPVPAAATPPAVPTTAAPAVVPASVPTSTPTPAVAAAEVASTDEQRQSETARPSLSSLNRASSTTNRFAKLRGLAKATGRAALEEKRAVSGEGGTAPAAEGSAGEGLVGVVQAAMQRSALEDYAEEHFNLNRKGLMNKRTSVTKVLKWKPDLIRTALRSLDPELTQDAVQSFRNITGYMGDRHSTKKPLEHVHKLLNMMVSVPLELKDEVYCQLCKQTNENPSLESTKKGWKLLYIVLATFPPSAEFLPFLSGYIEEHVGDPDGVGELAATCARVLPKIVELGARKEVATEMEVLSLEQLVPVRTRVYLLDGSSVVMEVDSWTTCADLEQKLMDRFGVTDGRPFHLFEVSTEDEERALDPDERIQDLASYWLRLAAEERSKRGARAAITEYSFCYKVRLFFDVPATDEAANHLMYLQSVHDIVDARYPSTEQDCVTLAAMQLQERYGDFEGNAGVLSNHLASYIPENLLGSNDSDLVDKVLKLYAKLQGYSRQDARVAYLDYVRKWKIYGATYFFVEPQNARHLPRQVVLAVNSKSILVVDPGTKSFLEEFPLGNIVTWGHSPNSFVVVTGDLVQQVKNYFRTDQGQELNAMVHAYMDAFKQARSAAGQVS